MRAQSQEKYLYQNCSMTRENCEWRNNKIEELSLFQAIMKTILLLAIALCNVSALILALIYAKLTNKIIKRRELKELHLENYIRNLDLKRAS